MAHITFEPCPGCGTDDPSDFTVTTSDHTVTAEEALIFLKTTDPNHTAMTVSCDVCDYSESHSVTIN